MSSPNAKLLLLLMLPFSLKMFLFLEFMTGVWSFAAFLTAWIIERLMEFLYWEFYLFSFFMVLDCYKHISILYNGRWRISCVKSSEWRTYKKINLIFILQPSINTLLISYGIVLNAHYFSALHQVFKFKRFSWNISHIYANIEFKGLGLWFFHWQFFFSIVHLSLPLTITHFSTYYIQHYDNNKVVA